MTFLQIIASVCLCVGAVITYSAAQRNHRKFLLLCEKERMIEEKYRHMMRTGALPKQPELFITANSGNRSKEITLKLSLDDIDIDKVQDRATREFLLKRRLMNTFCLN